MEGTADSSGAGGFFTLIEAAAASQEVSLGPVDGVVSTQGTTGTNTDGSSQIQSGVTTDGDPLPPADNPHPPGPSANNAPDPTSEAIDGSKETLPPPPGPSPLPEAPSTPVSTKKRETIDIADTPVKNKPPWMLASVDPPTHGAPMDVDAPTWFSDSLPSTNSESSNKLLSIIAVEKQIRKRFPKCQPMVPEMVEYLAHTTSPHDDTPTYHPDSLLENDYATALPLDFFSTSFSPRLY